MERENQESHAANKHRCKIDNWKAVRCAPTKFRSTQAVKGPAPIPRPKNGNDGTTSSRRRSRPRLHHRTARIMAGSGAMAVLHIKPKRKRASDPKYATRLLF